MGLQLQIKMRLHSNIFSAMLSNQLKNRGLKQQIWFNQCIYYMGSAEQATTTAAARRGKTTGRITRRRTTDENHLWLIFTACAIKKKINAVDGRRG